MIWNFVRTQQKDMEEDKKSIHWLTECSSNTAIDRTLSNSFWKSLERQTQLNCYFQKFSKFELFKLILWS